METIRPRQDKLIPPDPDFLSVWATEESPRLLKVKPGSESEREGGGVGELEPVPVIDSPMLPGSVPMVVGAPAREAGSPQPPTPHAKRSKIAASSWGLAALFHAMLLGALLVWWVARPSERKGAEPVSPTIVMEESEISRSATAPDAPNQDAQLLVNAQAEVPMAPKAPVGLNLNPPEPVPAPLVGEIPVADVVVPLTHPASGAAPVEEDQEGEPIRAVVGGLKIESRRLGVVLDISQSMEPFLPAVRQEIAAAFSDAPVKEIVGCFLNQREGYSIVDAIEHLVTKEKVDAVYWFTDLEDEWTMEGVSRLQWQLLAQPQGGFDRTALYVCSVGSAPTGPLVDLLLVSGGSWEQRQPGIVEPVLVRPSTDSR